MSNPKSTSKGKAMPVKKGGTRFPRYSLEQLASSTRKLVSKTHLGPVARDIIEAGVVETKGSTADVKISSLKQYGLIVGTSSAYEASPLAKAIVNSPDDEVQTHLKQAALNPPVFKAIFDAFHGDEVTVARIKQRATDLQVHPDSASDCQEHYVATLSYAGLVTANGDKIRHGAASAIPNSSEQEGADEPSSTGSEDGLGLSRGDVDGNENGKNTDKGLKAVLDGSTPKAIFHVNVNLDASLDIEKLERHLELLRKYGAI